MNPVYVFDIARRFEENPLLTPQQVSPGNEQMTVACLLNSAVFRFEKKIWLLARVAERPAQKEGRVRIATRTDGEIQILEFANDDPALDVSNPGVVHYNGADYPASLSHFRLMCSDDGKSFRNAEGYEPIFGQSELEDYGIEDGRVAEINGIYYLTYTMLSACGVGVGLMQTRDWKRFERKGMILLPHNRDCAIFEEKVRDRYYALHRPSSPEMGGSYIWIAESPDGIHWGRHKCVAKTRPGMWDSQRIGAGCSPIRIPEGWLAIYYGTDGQNRSCLGAMLLDLKDPARVISRSELPIMEPTEPYELGGLPGNGIFTNGHLVVGDRLLLYYSAGNEVICGAELSIAEILRAF